MKHYWGYKIVNGICSVCADKRMVKFDNLHPDITDEYGSIRNDWVLTRHNAIWGKQFEEPVMMFDYGRDHVYLCVKHLESALYSLKSGELDEI